MSSESWPPSRGRSGRQARVEREHARSSEVIARMQEGVLVLNASLTPVIANPAARSLFGWNEQGLPPTLGSDELTSLARRAASAPEPLTVDIRAGDRTVRVRAMQLEEGVALFLRDVTEELGTQLLRRQFAANASHELKTPVASLAALVEAIQSASNDEPEVAARFIERLGSEVDRLKNVIDDLMDLSRVEDPAAMSVDELDLREIVFDQTEVLAPIAEEEGITLVVDAIDGLRVRGDRQHLVLLVRNLVDNAIRYSAAGDKVRVTLAAEDGRALVRVEDEGIGIPVSAQSRIFERFFRVDEDRARLSGGTGLGLSIVKNVAESHGGTVTVSSELDEGSTFVVSLPLVEE